MKRPARIGAIAFALALCASAARAEDTERREELFRLHNTVLGPVGGVHIVDAASAPRNTFRIGLNADMFFFKGFISDNDRVKQIGGSLTLSYSIREYLEVFGAFLINSTSNTAGNPELIQSMGDVYLGLKGYHWVLPYLAVGADASVSFLSSVGSAGPSFESTSAGLRANLSADLRQLPKKAVPFIARFNVQYWFDQSANRIKDAEASRYSRLTNPLPPALDTRHLVTAIERFALGINRTDLLNIGLGFEAPLRAGKAHLSPLLEWAWGIPINRQGYSCIPAPVAPGDSCLDQAGISAFPMTITPALRILPPVRGLSITVGVEVGVTGTRTFVRELAPTAPYRVWVGLAYAIDPVQPKPAPSEPVHGGLAVVRLRGSVVEAGSGKPVGGAVVRVTDDASSALITGPKGEFSVLVPRADSISLEISHVEYPSTPCMVVGTPSPSAEVWQVECKVEAQTKSGGLRLTLIDQAERPVEGVPVAISGPLEDTLQSNAQGVVTADSLPPGHYSALVATPEYFVKMVEFDVVAGKSTSASISVVQRPKKPQVRVTKGRILIRSQISFATGSGEILPNSEPILLEVADALIQNSDIQLVEIQGHTDNRGSRKINKELSTKRAEAVQQWLIEHGVDASRLISRGYGPDRPLVPNLTAKNRARNRRVQFMIRKRAK